MNVYKYKDKWDVFPNHTLESLWFSSCNDTVNGVCTEGKTVKECIDECDKKEDCNMGYHIEFKNGKAICAPLRTVPNSTSNQAYRLRRQLIYPEMDRVNSTVFLDTTKYAYPPNDANTLFFLDIVTLYIPGGNMSLGNNSVIESGSQVVFFPGLTTNIQMVQFPNTVYNHTMRTPVRYGDFFSIGVAGTSLLMKIDDADGGKLAWRQTVLDSESNSFYFTPSTREIKADSNNNPVIFGERLKILHSTSLQLCVDKETGHAFLADANNLPPTSYTEFMLESKMNGHYCSENGTCAQVPVRNIEKNKYGGIYKGSPVWRDTFCFDQCPNDKYSHSHTYTHSTGASYRLMVEKVVFAIAIIIFSTIVVLVSLRYYFKHKYGFHLARGSPP